LFAWYTCQQAFTGLFKSPHCASRLPGQRTRTEGSIALQAVKPPWPTLSDTPDDPSKASRLNPIAEREATGETNKPNVGEDWTDYTRYALGIDDQTQDGQEGQQRRPVAASFTDRRRALGLDFGPEFTGLAMSLGGMNTMPIGTLKTGKDWKELALKVAQIASTRRARDIVVGLPLEIDGSEGRIAQLVRHFTQILADAVLLLLGGEVAVYLWDERFSTAYAAMRLVTRPRFDGALFKTWLDGQRGLDSNAKALLDSEAARAILEHWLEKDPTTEELNKERSERVAPSKQAALQYLKWKKIAPKKKVRPTEPGGSGKDWFEYDYLNPEESEVSPSEFWESQEANRQKSDRANGGFSERYQDYVSRMQQKAEATRMEEEAKGREEVAEDRSNLQQQL